MKFNRLFGIALLTLSTATFAAGPGAPGGGGQPGKGMGEHKGFHMLQPMPNLMRVVMHHGDQLDLSKEQAAALAAWRTANHERIQARMKAIATVRKVLQDAILRGANIAAVNVHLSHMDRVRAEIVAAKIACRDHMRKVLNDEQWEKVVELYRKHYM
jgi:Spy/CpxP family protein refolding chaperone